jgi:hypothetical protein
MYTNKQGLFDRSSMFIGVHRRFIRSECFLGLLKGWLGMPRHRKKKTEGGLVEVSSLLEGALQTLGVKGDFEKFKIEKKCRELLGDKFAKALTGVNLKGRTVQMEFNHSIWMNEMNFRKTEILSKLQKELPEIGIKTLNLILTRKT